MDTDTYEEEAVVMGIPSKVAWQLQILAGVITVILGIILSFAPSASLNVICVIIGILFILGGIFHFVRMLDRDEQHRVWQGIAALLEVVIGVVLIRHLDLSKAAIGLLIGIAWIVQGVVALMAGILGAAGRSRAWPIIFGVISIIAGAVVVSVPLNSVHVIAVLIGIWFLIMGILEINSGLFLRSDLKKLS